jgi:hypothetical protein
MASLRTPIGILSFPRLFVPKPRAMGAEAVFSISLLFDKVAQSTPEFAALRRAVADQIDETFGARKHEDKAFVATLRLPFRRCAEKKYKGYDIEGGVYIAAWSKDRPGVVDAHRREITVPADVWAGQMARATVAPFGYNNSGNKGVSIALNNVQITRTDGVRLDGRVAAEDDFDDVVDAGELVDEDAPF